jgi:hypothetical protein
MPRRDDIRDRDDRDDYEDRPRRRRRDEEDDRDDEPKKGGLSTTLIVSIVLGLLLVVGGVVAVGILVAGAGKWRSTADRITSTNNLKQIGLAMHSVHDTNNRLPPSVGRMPGPSNQDETLFFHILPYMERMDVYNGRQMNAVVRVYHGPGDPSLDTKKPLTSYATNMAVCGTEGRHLSKLPNGTSNTIVVVERYAVTAGQAHNWSDTGQQMTWISGTGSQLELEAEPEKAPPDAAHCFGSGVVPVLLGDMSVRLLKKGDAALFRWACNPNSMGPAPGEW